MGTSALIKHNVDIAVILYVKAAVFSLIILAGECHITSHDMR